MFVLHIFPITVSLAPAVADVKAKLIYRNQEKIFTPSPVLVVNRLKADDILRHHLFLADPNGRAV